MWEAILVINITYLYSHGDKQIAYCPYYDNGNAGYNPDNLTCYYIQESKPNLISYSTWLSGYPYSCLILQTDSKFPGYLEYVTTEHIGKAVYEINYDPFPDIPGQQLVRVNITSDNIWTRSFNILNIDIIYVVLGLYNVILLALCVVFIARICYIRGSSVDKDSYACIFMILAQRILIFASLCIDPVGIYHIIPYNLSRFISDLSYPWTITIILLISNKNIELAYKFPPKEQLHKMLTIINIVAVVIIVAWVGLGICELIWVDIPPIVSIIPGIIYIVVCFYFLYAGILFKCKMRKVSSAPSNVILIKMLSIWILHVISIIILIGAIFMESPIGLIAIQIAVNMIYGIINILQAIMFSSLCYPARPNKN